MFKYLFSAFLIFFTIWGSLVAQRVARKFLQKKLKKRAVFLSWLVAIFIFLLLGSLGLELAVRLFGAQSVIVRQVESGKTMNFMHDPHFLIKKTSKGLRLMRNAKVKILNHQLSKEDIEINTNSHGFRDEELEVKKEKEKRILFLGDSITLGDYLPAEEVFVEVVEKVLREKLETEIEVVNAGLSDVGIKEEMDILEEDGLATEPDLVILDFYLNDSRPPWGFYDEPDKISLIRRYSFAAEWIFNKLKLWRWFRAEKSRFDWILAVKNRPWKLKPDEFKKVASLARYDWGAAWEGDSWEVIEKGVKELKEKSEEYGFKIGIVILPVSFQIYADEPDVFPQKKMGEIADSMGIPIFDPLPILREKYEPNGVQLYYDQCHFTRRGNRIIGEGISDFIIGEKLLGE